MLILIFHEGSTPLFGFSRRAFGRNKREVKRLIIYKVLLSGK